MSYQSLSIPALATALSADDSDVKAPSSSSFCPRRCQSMTNQQESPNHPRLRIFYFIQVHNERTVHDAVHLIRSIRDPNNFLLIHFDKKAEALFQNETNPIRKELLTCPCGNSSRIECEFDVEWSHWSMNMPTLWALNLAVDEYADRWDIWINLSGDSLAVYDVNTMASILEQLPYNFVTSSWCERGTSPVNVYDYPEWWHKRRHYTSNSQVPYFRMQYTTTDGKKNITDLTAYFGSQWMLLQKGFVEWLVEELKRPHSLPTVYKDFLVKTKVLMTDESYIPTLLMHTHPFRDTLPKIDKEGYILWANQTSSWLRNMRYERMDEHVPTFLGTYPKNQRYQVPDSLVSRVDVPRNWGPYYLGVYDLGEIRRVGALFVRKVTERIDPNMVRLLPVTSANDIPSIDWPYDVSISPKPIWTDEYAQLYLTMSAKEAMDGRRSRDSMSEL